MRLVSFHLRRAGLLGAAALGASLIAAPALAQGIEATMNKAGCLACHAVDKKLVGPAYKEVAAKYKGKPEMVATLSAKVRKGGQGVWGPVPMPPTGPDKISDADLKSAIEWVLSR
ncbi:MAG: c-type cytochrome [Rubrivivax sp.]